MKIAKSNTLKAVEVTGGISAKDIADDLKIPISTARRYFNNDFPENDKVQIKSENSNKPVTVIPAYKYWQWKDVFIEEHEDKDKVQKILTAKPAPTKLELAERIVALENKLNFIQSLAAFENGHKKKD